MQKNEKNKIVLEFNNRIYPAKNIKRAIRDYAGLAKFTVKAKMNHSEILAMDVFNPDAFANEFSNYLLSLCINEQI